MLLKIMSLVSIMLLLFWMMYFIMGGLPLLILKHDAADDARLVRGFFQVHYLILIPIAAIGALCSAVAGRQLLAVAIGCIALVGFAARHIIVSRMDRLRTTMQPTDTFAIKKFRKLHVTGLALNAVLLVSFLSTLGFASAEIISCTQQPPGCQGDACRVQCSLLQ